MNSQNLPKPLFPNPPFSPLTRRDSDKSYTASDYEYDFQPIPEDKSTPPESPVANKHRYTSPSHKPHRLRTGDKRHGPHPLKNGLGQLLRLNTMNARKRVRHSLVFIFLKLLTWIIEYKLEQRNILNTIDAKVIFPCFFFFKFIFKNILMWMIWFIVRTFKLRNPRRLGSMTAIRMLKSLKL